MPLKIVVLSASELTRTKYESIPGFYWIQNFVNSISNLILSDNSNIYHPSISHYGPSYTDNNGNVIRYLEKVVSKFKRSKENKPVIFQEIYRDGLGRYAAETLKAAVVIYYINVLSNETPEEFVARAEEELTFLQKYDFSDAHVTKHIVINFSAKTDLHFKNHPALVSFERFTLSQGFKTTDDNKKACFTIDVGDPKSGVVNDYLDTLIRNNSEPNLLSRFLGAFFYGLLGGITGLLLFNPLNEYFTIWSQTCWKTPLNVLISCFFVLIAPPFLYTFYLFKLLISSVESGWDRGLLVGLESPFYIASNNFSEISFYKKRNLFASLAIIGLATAAVLLTLGIFGPAVVGGIGLAALTVKGATIAAGYLGLSGSAAGVAVAAGAAVVLAGSVIYGIGYGAFLGLKAFINQFRSPTQAPEKNTRIDLSHQVALEYSPSSLPATQPAPGAEHPLGVGLASEAERTPLAAPAKPSLRVVTQPEVQQQQHQDAFGHESYRSVFATPAPAAAAPKGSPSRPGSPAPEPKASPMESPPPAGAWTHMPAR